jgi:hypothetical protein
MSFEENLMGRIHAYLSEKGLHDFYVSEVELVPRHHQNLRRDAAPPQSSDLSVSLEGALEDAGLGDFQVKDLHLLVRAAAPCQQLADGSYRYRIECKKAMP